MAHECPFSQLSRKRISYFLTSTAKKVFIIPCKELEKDIDVLVDPSRPNSVKIVRALNDFGFKSLKLNKKDFRVRKRIIQLGYEPLRVDLLTVLEGLAFNRA
ncbi:MAG: hypothetical protein WCC06_01005 [Candidatus Aminicenantales bacterium]